MGPSSAVSGADSRCPGILPDSARPEERAGGGDPGLHPVTPKAASQLGPSSISSLIRGTVPKMADTACIKTRKRTCSPQAPTIHGKATGRMQTNTPQRPPVNTRQGIPAQRSPQGGNRRKRQGRNEPAPPPRRNPLPNKARKREPLTHRGTGLTHLMLHPAPRWRHTAPLPAMKTPHYMRTADQRWSSSQPTKRSSTSEKQEPTRHHYFATSFLVVSLQRRTLQPSLEMEWADSRHRTRRGGMPQATTKTLPALIK
ncbi:Hypothetical predicted protein [Pelobates cultripes]|uniref:Uncharacterized protein n=1 Tax=Pelobates cultripes TaxID=61616 RepID=A0AAD1R6Z4_PELCU|nr:Hypothetical predicted protein [Pelobates cultripes]